MSLESRLSFLETEVRRLTERADQSPERAARLGQRRSPRLAQAVEKSGTTYPAASDTPNTYWIKFLDSTFTETLGDQTPTHTARQSDAAVLAHFRDRTPYKYIPEDSILTVFFDNGRWWIERADKAQHKARFIEFELGTALATTDASIGNVTVTDFWGGFDPDPTPSTITIYNKSESGGNYLFEADVGDEGMAVWDDIDDKYRIWQMECP